MGLLSLLNLQTLIIFLLVLYLGLKLWKKSKNRPPGPLGIPFFGYLLFIDKEAPYETFLNLKKKYGKIFSVQMGGVPTVVISDPYVVRKIFATDAFSGRAPLYLTHGIMKGHGIICAEGDTWREHRKFISSVMRKLGMKKNRGRQDLTQQILAGRVPEFIQFLKENEGQPVDIVPKLRHCIGNVTNELVFGVTYQEDDPTWVYLQHLLDEGFKQVAVAGPLNFLPILRFLPKFWGIMDFILTGQRETHIHYEEILSKIEPDSTQYSSVAEAYLSEMRSREADPGSFTKVQLNHVLADLFGAGTDTAMTTIKWILLYVMKYPEVQRKIQEELDQVIGRTENIDLSDIEKLNYLEAVIMEVQRSKNILPLGFPHGCVEDTEVEGYHIPKGTMVMPFLWAMNLDEELWKDPHVFRPERFLDPETGKIVKPDHFMPFQTGRRMCLGEDFGRLTLLYFTSAVLQNCSIKLEDEDYDLDKRADFGFTLVPRKYRVIPTLR